MALFVYVMDSRGKHVFFLFANPTRQRGEARQAALARPRGSGGTVGQAPAQDRAGAALPLRGSDADLRGSTTELFGFWL